MTLGGNFAKTKNVASDEMMQPIKKSIDPIK